MIGVTAAASAGLYFSRGQIDPFIAAPVAIGVLAGALPARSFCRGWPAAPCASVRGGAGSGSVQMLTRGLTR